MCVYLFYIWNSKEVTHHQYLYKPGISNSEYILCRERSNSMKDIGKCTRSDKINSDLGQISKEKICVDLIGSYNT